MNKQTFNTKDTRLFEFFRNYDRREALNESQLNNISWIYRHLEEGVSSILLIHEGENAEIPVERLVACNWNTVIPRDF